MVLTNATEIAGEVAKQTEKLILEQLNDFVSRGLIQLEMGPMSFVQEPSIHSSRNEIKIVQTCRLVLKDKEYIEKLEKENKELREILARVRSNI